MFEASQSSDSDLSGPRRPLTIPAANAAARPKVSFTQTVKSGKPRGAAQVFPPKMPPTGIPVDAKPKDSWQTVQCKKATRLGTKATMVLAIIPAAHQIPCTLLMSTNEEAVTRHYLGILELIPGAKALLANNPLKQAYWSLNREVLHVVFQSPIDDNLHAMAHLACHKLFNVSDDSEPVFLERPTISSVKWASVPCYDADNKEISKQQLADQILHQGLFAELKIVNGPIWIVPSTGDKGSYATVKLDFEDN